MAPLPPDSTGRLFIDYETCGYDHTALIRLGAGVTPADGADEFNTLITGITGLFYLSTFLGARFAPAGSNIANPVTADWPVSWGSGAGPAYATAQFVDFIGRSLDGRRVRFSLFGAALEQFNNRFRVPAADSTAVNNGVTTLNAAEGTFVSINGFQPVWKQYANIGPNAYWRNKVR